MSSPVTDFHCVIKSEVKLLRDSEMILDISMRPGWNDAPFSPPTQYPFIPTYL
jgi:hypothetical protein